MADAARLPTVSIRLSLTILPLVELVLLLLLAAGVIAALGIRRARERSALGVELKDARDRLEGIIQSAMDAIITTDADQNIVLFNAAAERIFCCTGADAVGSPLDRFIPERFRPAHRSHVEAFGVTGTTSRLMGGPRPELVGLRETGEEFPIDASISQVTVEGRKLYTVILRDVTEQRAAEQALKRSFEELREMSASLHEVREAERTRVARELHDELAQWLTALKMDVSWLAARLPEGHPQLVARTEKMREVVDATVGAVRRIASDLRPVMLDDLGLVPAVEHLLNEFSGRTGVPVALDAHLRDADFGDPLATAVYRMVQEALTNVARHARASQVRVTLATEGGALLVAVRDNGVGLEAQAPGRKSYGLMGIRERAQTLGGSARIHTPPEGGTLVEISIPLGRFRRREAAA